MLNADGSRGCSGWVGAVSVAETDDVTEAMPRGSEEEVLCHEFVPFCANS